MSESGSFTFGSLNDEPVFWLEPCDPRLELLLDPLIPELLESRELLDPLSPEFPELLEPLRDELLSLFLFRLFGILPPAPQGALIAA